MLCCLGRTVIVKYYASIFLPQLSSMPSACICGLSNLSIFFTLSHKRHHFRYKIVYWTYVFWFSVHLLCGTFLILRRNEIYLYKYPTRCNNDVLFYCKITLHVSSTLRAYRQEFINCSWQSPVYHVLRWIMNFVATSNLRVVQKRVVVGLELRFLTQLQWFDQPPDFGQLLNCSSSSSSTKIKAFRVS
jgi:hypothetical protein